MNINPSGSNVVGPKWLWQIEENIKQTEFLKFRIDILAYYACRINKDSIIEYDNTVKTILSEEDYKKYIKLKQPRLSFIERIFSVKKVLINCYPHKVITILGFAYTYQIKSPIQSNKALR